MCVGLPAMGNKSTRENIIYRALVDKVSQNMEVFFSDDILVAAGISEEDIQQFICEIKKALEEASKKGDKFIL